MGVRSILSDEIKRACDVFLESRGFRPLTFREGMNKDATEGLRRKLPPEEDPMEKVAREIEKDSKG